MNKNPKKDERAGVGMAFTCAWVGMLVVYVVSNFDKVTNLDPNEFGDFLAGAFGPVALFWLVIGYFQQGEELQQNTEALRLQHEELVRSVAEQKLLVAEQQAQTAIAKTQLEEQRRRYVEESLDRMRAAQPRFVVSGHFVRFGETTITWKILVQSYDNNCTDVSLTVSLPGETIRCSSVNELKADKSVEFGFELSDAIEGGGVAVSYRDMLGHRRSQSFVMEQVLSVHKKELKLIPAADVEEDHVE